MIAVYLRVSTSKQETRAQQDAVANWCRERGYRKTAEYVDEGVSGKTLQRPAFKRLIADVRAGKVQKIVTFELSRLSRDFLDLLEVMRTLTEHGVVVEVPGEGSVQFDSTMEQFIVAAKSLVAAQERERLSARTKAGMAAARARGAKIGAQKGDRRALGFRKDYVAEAPELVRKIRSLARRGLSTFAIADAVSSEEAPVSRAKVMRILARTGN
jgi:putative DNA-invertase from lambdoid prophage Rac